MGDPEDERNVCYFSTILHQPIFFRLPLERLVSSLLSWAHFLSGKGYNSDQRSALLVSFVLGKHSQCLELGREVGRGAQTQLQRTSPSSGSHQHSHSGGGEGGNPNNQTNPLRSPPAHTSPTATRSLFVLSLPARSSGLCTSGHPGFRDRLGGYVSTPVGNGAWSC